MAAELRPLPFERLLDWIRREREARGSIFGLHEDTFRIDLSGRPIALALNGRRLETPVGVAAGPHTQLSQNLVAAWLCGARVLELKTVQVRDRLDIPRPCIDMRDEGYNCEWSQELSLDDSFAQYADGWTAIRLLQMEAGVLDPDEPGFLMDMSVGYDLVGVKSAPVQRFLDRMADSRAAVEARLAAARPRFGGAGDVTAPERLADSVTLSTMHGCPPEEIEAIARFLIEERGLHVQVKLNPTLLGAEALRELLNGRLGWRVEVPDAAFAEDLNLDAAADLVASLRGAAARAGVDFGVKLTNTLACLNRGAALPAAESTVYLSGRALHPVAIAVAARLREACGAELPVSFAGGVDAANVASVAACGLLPATSCSDLLRPGGVQRLLQYVEELEAALAASGAADLAGFAAATCADPAAVAAGPGPAALANLRAYAERAAADPAYRADAYADRSTKTPRPLAALDCVRAPCVQTCPAGQDVPGYLRHAARGDFHAALGVILRDNPFPAVTGMVCDHPCVERCARVHIEAAVGIRDVKRACAHAGAAPPAPLPAAPSGQRAAVIGAGPAGLACAWFLALAGVETTVHETKAFAGGMAADAIPRFRLPAADVAADLERIEAAGVRIQTGDAIDRAGLDALLAANDAVFLGVGLQADRALGVPGEDLPGVWPALRLLAAARRGEPLDLGREVLVVGGGNTTMDAARTAVRLVGPEGTVRLVYRRTRALMPAAREELRAIGEEGVVIEELWQPERIEREGGKLVLLCRRMRLGEPDASGRPRPEPLPDGAPDATRAFTCDTVVTAVGQELAGDLVDEATLRDAGPDGAVPDRDGLWLGGDLRRGAATLVDAIGDGRRAAAAILARLGLAAEPSPAAGSARCDELAPGPRQARAARRLSPLRPPTRAVSAATAAGDFGLVLDELTQAQAREEAARCLDCDLRCDVCVSVCPDRAFLSYAATPVRWELERVLRAGDGWVTEPDDVFVVAQAPQTAVVADLCNACGNCETFCPTAGAPYRDKPRLAATAESYAAMAGEDVCLLERLAGGLRLRARRGGGEETLTRLGGRLVYETASARVTLDAASFAVEEAVFLAPAGAPTGALTGAPGTPGAETVELRRAAELAVLLDGLAAGPLAVAAAKEG